MKKLLKKIQNEYSTELFTACKCYCAPNEDRALNTLMATRLP